MANICNRKGVWYARFRHDGKEYLRSTGISVPANGAKAIRASRIAAEAELYRMKLELKGGESVDALYNRLVDAIDLLPAKERESRRIALSDRLRTGVISRMNIDEAWSQWVSHPNRGHAGNSTVAMYESYWGKEGRANGFRYWLANTHPEIKWMHDITRSIAEDYASYLKAKGLAPRTYNGAIKFLSSMFKTLKNRAGLGENVWEGISRAPTQTEGRRNLTPEELRSVCGKAEGDLRYLIALGLYTGLRLGDCVILRWNAGTTMNGSNMTLGVKLEEEIIRIIPTKTSRKKKLITIPIHPVLMSLLWELRDTTKGSDYLFPELAKIYAHGDSARITNRIQKLFRDCGIETSEEIEGRSRVAVRVGFHSLRHSFVSLCAANRVPQVAIQDLVGHGSPAMTALYAHADDNQKVEAIKALPTMAFSEAN